MPIPYNLRLPRFKQKFLLQSVPHVIQDRTLHMVFCVPHMNT